MSVNFSGGDLDFGQLTEVDSASDHEVVTTLRPLLPMVLAATVIWGSVLPWVTIRGFDGKAREYSLLDIKSGTSVVMTVFLFALIGAVVTLFSRRVGYTVMSLAVTALGWMAAISSAMLGLVGAFLPSMSVAGLDLTKSVVSQGSGVPITVIASLALAFMVVRQFPPMSKYSPSTSLNILPVVALVPLIVIAINMHLQWMVLASENAEMRAIVSGDSLFGSQLLVIILWLNVGLWIAAIMIQRSVMMKIAGVASIVIALITAMYAIFLWGGGKALAWLIPGNVEQWASVDIGLPLYVVFVSSIALLILGVMSFTSGGQNKSVSLIGRRTISSQRVYTVDIVAVVIVLLMLMTTIFKRIW